MTAFLPLGRLGSEALARQPLCVKVSEEVAEAVRSLDNHSEWLRHVITEAAKRELIPDKEGT